MIFTKEIITIYCGLLCCSNLLFVDSRYLLINLGNKPATVLPDNNAKCLHGGTWESEYHSCTCPNEYLGKQCQTKRTIEGRTFTNFKTNKIQPRLINNENDYTTMPDTKCKGTYLYGKPNKEVALRDCRADSECTMIVDIDCKSKSYQLCQGTPVPDEKNGDCAYVKTVCNYAINRTMEKQALIVEEGDVQLVLRKNVCQKIAVHLVLIGSVVLI